ncbi:hypothetical protein ACFE04_003745 [Oxalis oulophora]
MVGFEEMLKGGRSEEELLYVSRIDPIVLELNRLQNQLKEKERELGVARCEIKALRATDASKDKAIKDLRNQVNHLDDKLDVAENVLDHKNLEIKKLTNEKKEALAAQYAAEATLRRVRASQQDDTNVSIETIIAPLEAEIKMYKNEITALQEDKKAMERLTKSKESALLEAERILKSALERALIVEEVQNQNFELRRQIEICQEENKILEKTIRQKVLDVESLGQTIQELEENILAGGAVANTIRDYRRKISELQEEKKTLERELARVKVSANRVATVIANEWKDENDKVMPVKQWLEERRILKAEMQRLRDKLVILERTAKTEAQLKEKLKLRLGTLEEGLKTASNFTLLHGSPMAKKSHNILNFLTSSGGLKKRSTSQPRGSTIGRISPLQQPNGENISKRSIWPVANKIIESSGKENTEMKTNQETSVDKCKDNAAVVPKEIKCNEERQNKGDRNPKTEDIVSGFLYDRLQKEVIALRKLCQVKDSNLNCKDEEITMLVKKVEKLIKREKREATPKERKASRQELTET